MSNAVTIIPVKVSATESLVRYVAVMAGVAAITVIYRHLRVNPTTVAVTFLLLVLWVAASWGLRYSVAAAVLGTIALNYSFLPPVGTLTIADPQNWVALLAFLTAGIVASQLSERARREAVNANQRRREVEKLYALSQRLLTSDNAAELLNAMPGYLRQVFGTGAAAMYLLDSQEVYRSDPRADWPSLDDLKSVALRGEPVTGAEPQFSLIPLRLGTRITGAVGISGTKLSRETSEAVGSLVALAIERAGMLQKIANTEATRQSENLRVALLDSVTHELRTPLTGIKAAVTSMLSGYQLDDAQRNDLLTVINEEADRLDRLVSEATEVAQLDAHHVELQLEPTQMRSVIETVLHECRDLVVGHEVAVTASENLPPVNMDAARIGEVLKHLLENAAKYSPAGTPITITVEQQGRQLTTSVADRGPGIDDFEQQLIFEKFYRGRDQRYRVQGTGLGLAIVKAVIEAHGGKVGVTSQPGRGSVFYFSLPIGQN